MKAYLFKAMTPNDDGGVHYFPNALSNAGFSQKFFNQLLAEAGSTYLTYDVGTFRVFDGYIDVQPAAGDDLWNITYIALQVGVVDNNIKYRFYKVREIVEQPQGIRFTVELDEWATYLETATICNPHIHKTNRKLKILDPTGDYIDANLLYRTDTIEYRNEGALVRYPVRWKINDMYRKTDLRFVLFIKYSLNPSIFKEKNNIDVFVFSVTAEDNLFEVYEQLRNIYQTEHGEAQVQRCYIVTSDMFPYEYTVNRTFKTLDSNGNEQSITLQGITLNASGTIKGWQAWRKQIILNFGKSGASTDTNGILNYNYSNVGETMRFGTLYNSIELDPYVGQIEIDIVIALSNSELKITISSPNGERDVTGEFEIPIVTSDVLTGTERITKVLNIGAQFAGIKSSWYSGNVAGVAQSAAAATSQLFKPGVNKATANNTGGGANGWATLQGIIFTGTGAITPVVDSVFYLFTTRDGRILNNDPDPMSGMGANNVRNNGAYCEYIPFNYGQTINYILNISPEYLLPLTSTGDNPYTFIQADVSIEQCIQSAAETIALKFSQGVRLKLI